VVLTAAAPARAAAPVVDELVVFKDGTSKTAAVRAASVHVKVGRRSCAVPAGTALAALVKLKPGKLGLTDYGSCSSRARDAGGLYVRSIASDKARKEDGWVYKVGRKLAPAGAADPTGPFGRGLLKTGQDVLWFYCDADPVTGSCQRTLEVKVKASAGHLAATVRGYDNNGHGIPVAGAQVHAGEATATTGDDGSAALDVPAGTYDVFADKDGLVRSLGQEAQVP
jgi:hypothetical protein